MKNMNKMEMMFERWCQRNYNVQCDIRCPQWWYWHTIYLLPKCIGSPQSSFYWMLLGSFSLLFCFLCASVFARRGRTEECIGGSTWSSENYGQIYNGKTDRRQGDSCIAQTFIRVVVAVFVCVMNATKDLLRARAAPSCQQTTSTLKQSTLIISFRSTVSNWYTAQFAGTCTYT